MSDENSLGTFKGLPIIKVEPTTEYEAIITVRNQDGTTSEHSCTLVRVLEGEMK